uniref:ubiquitinyl hydrolase 1 n=1 Tax=Aureoumbra lagunensis TaxID=44058 RepID=A0A7S3K4C6_9STRA|mmetsp:Transcript_3305/g.4587  ORF Transcript_3305/g.4587 Transcript_3305/m.4587 type:complete len:319 (-) Transcript_3305:351-1307(-)
MVIKGISDLNNAESGGGDSSNFAAFGDGPVDGEKMSSDFYGLLHEKQIGALCAVHALNNLMQERRFDEVQLASIAMELDEAERVTLGGERLAGEHASENVRADGFFSVQVVVLALQRVGVMCSQISADKSSESYVSIPARESGFILNRREHWFALRKVGGEWFDLNSMFAAPKHMSAMTLDSFFKEQQALGYSIFVVRGALPSSPLDSDRKRLQAAISQCKYQAGGSLPGINTTNDKGGDTDFKAFSGSGQSLNEPQIDPALLAAAQNDPDLAAAISASLTTNASMRDAKSDADEIRRKRLARFENNSASNAQKPRSN